MSDGIAPAIDKVGEPAPNAPEAEAGAPTIATSKPTSDAPTSASTALKDASKDKPEDKSLAIPDGAGPAVGAPKPVTVVSVPPTPMDNTTPAGGTPRPELNLDEIPAPAEPANGTFQDKKSDGDSPPGEKRKLDEAADSAKGPSTAPTTTIEEPADKKIKVNGDSLKGAKVKKAKKASPPIGRTARQTRSQGPVHV